MEPIKYAFVPYMKYCLTVWLEIYLKIGLWKLVKKTNKIEKTTWSSLLAHSTHYFFMIQYFFLILTLWGSLINENLLGECGMRELENSW